MATYQLHVALGTHQGRLRDRNEDAVGYHYPSDWEILNTYGALFILADGVGGLAKGNEVSELAIKRLIEIYYHEPFSQPEAMLRQSIQQVNSEIYRQFHAKSATTLVAILVRQSDAYIAHIGDSRAYYGKPSPLQAITRDHAAEGISNGKPKRKLTRALGYRAGVEVSITKQDLESGDIFLAVTDGASRYHDTKGLSALVSANPRESVQAIIETSNVAGGADNISAIVLQLGKTLSDAKAHSTHLRQIAEVGIMVELPAYPEDDAKSVNSSPLLILVLFLGALALVAGIFLFVPRAETSQVVASISASPEIRASESPSTIMPTVQLETLAPTEFSLVSNYLIFEDSALTYTQVQGTSSAYLLQANKRYLVQELFTDSNETWIRLYDEENERSGWIAEAAMPAYRLAGN